MVAHAITGGDPTLETPIIVEGVNYYLEIADNELRLSKSDITAPVLVDIINDLDMGANYSRNPRCFQQRDEQRSGHRGRHQHRRD